MFTEMQVPELSIPDYYCNANNHVAESLVGPTPDHIKFLGT
jgi:hypothetical protein